jgi:hypothetical protein
MRSHKVKLFIVGMLAAIALAWGVKNFIPSIIEAEKVCTSTKVVDDMSRELLICYNEMDRCNKYFRTCIDAYLQLQEPKETLP